MFFTKKFEAFTGSYIMHTTVQLSLVFMYVILVIHVEGTSN